MIQLEDTIFVFSDDSSRADHGNWQQFISVIFRTIHIKRSTQEMST